MVKNCWCRMEEVREEEEEEREGSGPRLWMPSIYSRLEELHTETEKSR